MQCHGDPVQACERGDLVRACVQEPSACMCGDPVQACMREPSACVRAWGPGRACMCGDTLRACVGTRCMHAWDPVRACVGPGARMRGTRCVRGDPAGMGRVWGPSV